MSGGFAGGAGTSGGSTAGAGTGGGSGAAPGAGGHIATADVSGLSAYLEGMGLDRQGSTPNTQGMITRALTSLDPSQRLSVLMGGAALAPGPMRGLFSRLAGTMAAPSLGTAYAQGDLDAHQATEIAQQMQSLVPAGVDWAAQASEALRRGGMTDQQLEELVGILTWESRPEEERIHALLEGQRIFEMPVEKVLGFLRELLEAGRNQEFLRLMRHFGSGLVVPAVARRLVVAQAFELIAAWAEIPGMPPVILDELIELLTHAFRREKNPEVLQCLSRGLEHLLWFLLETGDCPRAAGCLAALRDEEEELGVPLAWKEQAAQDLLQRLGSPERLDMLLARMFNLDRADAAEQIHPIFALLGTAAANHLVERLSLEQDRASRVRIMEALRACGPVVEGPLLESLKSGEWFVVRNALLLLAEVAGPERVPDVEPFVDNHDTRVRLAAVRALGRLGGREAETALTRLLGRPDPGLQMEVLFLLDNLRVRNAVPAILQLLRTGKGWNRPGLDKLREKALEVLGHLGSVSAIPALLEVLARRKGFFRDTREPLPARLCALRALASLASPEGLAAIRGVLSAEPAGPEREALETAFQETGAQPG